LRYVGLWTLWKYLCFSTIFSRGRNGGSGSDDGGASGDILFLSRSKSLSSTASCAPEIAVHRRELLVSGKRRHHAEDLQSWTTCWCWRS